jgi:hypothetical protein
MPSPPTAVGSLARGARWKMEVMGASRIRVSPATRRQEIQVRRPFAQGGTERVLIAGGAIATVI